MAYKDEYYEQYRNQRLAALKDPSKDTEGRYKNMTDKEREAFLLELETNPYIGELEEGGAQANQVTLDYERRLAEYNDPENPATKERRRTEELAKAAKDTPGLSAQTILGGAGASAPANSVLGGQL